MKLYLGSISINLNCLIYLSKVEVRFLLPNGKALSIEKVKDFKDVMKLVPKDAKDFYKFLSSINTLGFKDDIDGFEIRIEKSK